MKTEKGKEYSQHLSEKEKHLKKRTNQTKSGKHDKNHFGKAKPYKREHKNITDYELYEEENQ